jgi:hypothetical protein
MEAGDPDARLIRHIVQLIEENGWLVREADMGKRVMFKATRGDEVQIVTANQGQRYTAVCELALKVGIDLEE